MKSADKRSPVYRTLVRMLDAIAGSPASGALIQVVSFLLRRSPYRMRGRALLAAGLEKAIICKAGGAELIAHIHGGAKFKVPPVPEGASLLLYGCLPGPGEQKITLFLERFLKPADTFIDIGANVGFYALLAATISGPQGRIIAFEPQSDLAANLARCVTINGWSDFFTVRNVALSDTDEDNAKLFLPIDGRSRGNASFLAYSAVDGNQSVAATVRKGENELALLKIDRVAAAKVDVEGFEAKVIRGLRSFLESCPPPVVIAELFPASHENVPGAKAAVSLISELGYAIFDVSREGSLLGPLPVEFWLAIPSARSYAFVHSGAVARLAKTGLLR